MTKKVFYAEVIQLWTY